jgi:hypothetical protein
VENIQRIFGEAGKYVFSLISVFHVVKSMLSLASFVSFFMLGPSTFY